MGMTDRANASRYKLMQTLVWPPTSVGAAFCFRLTMEMFHAVTLSVHTAGVSLPSVCRHTSAGPASAVSLGCAGAGRWHTCPKPGRLQALLRSAKRPISDHDLRRLDNNVYGDVCLRGADLLLCCYGL